MAICMQLSERMDQTSRSTTGVCSSLRTKPEVDLNSGWIILSPGTIVNSDDNRYHVRDIDRICRFLSHE